MNRQAIETFTELDAAANAALDYLDGMEIPYKLRHRPLERLAEAAGASHQLLDRAGIQERAEPPRFRERLRDWWDGFLSEPGGPRDPLHREKQA